MVLSNEECVFLVGYVFQETYGPLARWILLHQTFICGEQQNLQCIMIAHTRLTAIAAYIRNVSQADLRKVFQIKLNAFRPV